MYNIEIKPEAISKLKKLKKKDIKSFQNVLDKIKEVARILETNPGHFKIFENRLININEYM